MKVKINIRDFIGENADHNDMVLVHASVDVDDLFDSNCIPEEQDIDIDDLLADHRAISLVWEADHVQDQRPDLTDDQAWEVLQECQRCWDRSSDPMLETIRQVAENLYPTGKETLRRRIRALLARLESLPEREADDPAAYGEVGATLDCLEAKIKEA